MTPQQARETAEKNILTDGTNPDIDAVSQIIGDLVDDRQYCRAVSRLMDALTAARADERRKFMAKGYGVMAHPGGWPVGEPTRFLVVEVSRDLAWRDEDGRWFADEYVFDSADAAEAWTDQARANESAALAARRKESGE